MKEKDNSCDIKKKTSIGGQALMEGIMMRGPKTTAIAVRNPEGEMVIEKWDTEFSANSKVRKIPIIRGCFNFFDSMKFGYKCLMRSAEISGLEAAEEELRLEKEKKKAEKAAKKAGKAGIELPEQNAEEAKQAEEAPACEPTDSDIAEEKSNEDENAGITSKEEAEQTVTEAENKNSEKIKQDKKEKNGSSAMTTVIMVFSVVFAFALAIGLFVFLPEQIYSWFSMLFKSVDLKAPGYGNQLIRALFTGVIRIVFLVIYMSLISLMKDIRRTFMFHGAEHKSIFCYEKRLDLTVENIRKQRRFHPRCGTSFLILMMIVGILIGMFIPNKFSEVIPEFANTIIRTAIKLLLIPLMVGIGYELIKIAGRHDNLFTRIISAPGMWLQRITTKEPDDDMIECAIAALKEVIPPDDSDKF